MTDSILGQIASTGLAGAMLVVALLALRSKDRELKAEMEASKAQILGSEQRLRTEMQARIDDAQKYTTLAMSLQREVIQAVHKMAEMLDVISELRSDSRSHRREKPSAPP